MCTLSDERAHSKLETAVTSASVISVKCFAPPGAGRATRRAGALDEDRQEGQARPGGESRLRQRGSGLSLGVDLNLLWPSGILP